MSTVVSTTPEPRSPWARVNAAELRVRKSIANDNRLHIFASVWRPAQGEAVILITARDVTARTAARTLLGPFADADWSNGWRELDLGDAIIELHPERPTTT